MFARRHCRRTFRRTSIRVETLLVLAIFFGEPAAAVAGGCDGASGFVFETTGDWISGRTGEPLGMVQCIFAPDEIKPPRRPKRGSSVAMAFYDGTAVRLACRSRGACDDAYRVRTPPAEGSFLDRLGRALGLLAPSELDLLAVPAVRGSGPREAVLVITGGSLDLAPALAEVGPGRYTVALRPWTKTGAAAQGIAIKVVWRPPQATALSGAPPEEGLYELTLTDRGGDIVGGALVLIAPDAGFAAASQAFQRVRNLADKWEAAVGEVAARRFQVESLLALARDPSVARGGQ
jgi:hypothetical protein